MTKSVNAGRPRVVILGAGFGGVYTLLNLHRLTHGLSEIDIVLVNDTNYFLFTPLLHEVATGGVALPIVVESLRGLLSCCLHEFLVARVETVDVDRRVVTTSRGDISFDYLVLALGSTTNFFDVPGAAEHALALKTLIEAKRLKNHLIGRLELALRADTAAERGRLLRFVVVGGGPTGVEVAAELADLCFGTIADLYPGTGLSETVEVILVQAQSSLLPNMPDKFGRTSLEILRNKKVDVRLEASVRLIDANGVVLDSGERLESATPIWVAGVKPQPIMFVGDVPRDEAGRVVVEPTLQVKGHQRVFALGDMARFVNPGSTEPVKALAQVASKQGRAVAHNIVAIARGAQLRPYRYEHAGELVSLGRWRAVANIHGLFFSGRFAWWLWRSVYLTKMLSWRKKFKVAIDWTWDLFTPRDISQLP